MPASIISPFHDSYCTYTYIPWMIYLQAFNHFLKTWQAGRAGSFIDLSWGPSDIKILRGRPAGQLLIRWAGFNQPKEMRTLKFTNYTALDRMGSIYCFVYDCVWLLHRWHVRFLIWSSGLLLLVWFWHSFLASCSLILTLLIAKGFKAKQSHQSRKRI